jgi:hypothetical protein
MKLFDPLHVSLWGKRQLTPPTPQKPFDEGLFFCNFLLLLYSLNMKKFRSLHFGISSILLFFACGHTSEKEAVSLNKQVEEAPNQKILIHEDGMTISTRFETPEGFNRVNPTTNSWAAYLQSLPLKTHGTKVLNFDGTLKTNTAAYCAVVDLSLHGNQNHQCADAIMRLRAEYLFEQKRYSEITFLFVSGKNFVYTDYLAGKTPTSANLWSYLEKVFAYASTLSLDKQLTSKDSKDLQIGDVFIKGGSPGHAVVVVDKCTDRNGAVKFMLAQSYMPAQDIQILVGDDGKSPWYNLDFGDYLYSAEYTFSKHQLKRF